LFFTHLSQGLGSRMLSLPLDHKGHKLQKKLGGTPMPPVPFPFQSYKRDKITLEQFSRR
jgi:hypothetical protein